MIRLTLTLVCACLAGCVAFNQECQERDRTVVGATESVLDLRKGLLRSAEAPVGDLVADAFYERMTGSGATLAVVNAGSIRELDDCRATPFIDRGPVTRGDLDSMLPFGNTVALVEVTGRELVRALEHAVAQLGDPGPIGLSGAFLQVSHLRFTVDCRAPAAVGDQVGQRVSSPAIVAADGSLTPLSGAALDERLRIATSSFIAGGGDGYSYLSALVADSGVSEVEAVEAHFDAAPRDTVAPAVEGRITLLPSCAPAAGP